MFMPLVILVSNSIPVMGFQLLAEAALGSYPLQPGIIMVVGREGSSGNPHEATGDKVPTRCCF